jgi:Ca2+-binding RTX toxin-like protein
VETLRTTNDAGTGAINLTGNGLNNYVVGNAGVNVLDGKGGVDTMQGLGGNDTYYVESAGEAIIEAVSAGADTVRATVDYQLTAGQEIEAFTTTDNNGASAINLTGNGNLQTIVGNAGFNTLQGMGGDDYLQGRAGHDTLTGGAGNDKFLFNTTLNAATNVDTITDMTAGVDIIRLDDAFFAGIGPVGVLNSDAFHIGAAAADAEDRIVYNSVTGQLFFDSNGNAAGGSTLFANLATGLALSNTDFNVV